MMYESGNIVRVPECSHCGTRNAKGLEVIFDDYRVDFQCDTCGKVMIQGELESSINAAMESKYGRELAEQNRDRYMRERNEQWHRQYKDHLESFKAIPDCVETFYESMEADFKQYQWILDRKAERSYKGMYADDLRV